MARRTSRRPAFVVATVVGGAVLLTAAGVGARAADPPAGGADPSRRSFTAEEYRVEQARLSGASWGMGLRLGIVADRLVVSEVSPGTPAASAGLLTGEQVVAVEDEPVDADDLASVVRALRASRSVDAVVAGADGTRRVRLVPGMVAHSSVTRHDRGGRIPVVDVDEVVRGSAREVADAVEDPDLAGVVLDLRGNSGGLITEAVAVAGVFLGSGDGVTYTRSDGSERVIDLPRDAVRERAPLVVLVDERTASAAEVVAGLLQDHGRAVLVGTPTYGKGTVQEPVRMADGSVMRRTVGAYVLPSGRELGPDGLIPDVVVPTIGDDATAEKVARDVLRGLAPAALDRG